jgi:hypothetical protein
MVPVYFVIDVPGCYNRFTRGRDYTGECQSGGDDEWPRA